MSDDASSELGDLISRARRDGASPERLAAVRARLEAVVGPLDAPPTVPATAPLAKVALGVAAVAALGLAAWLATRPDSPAPTPALDDRRPHEVPTAPSRGPQAPEPVLPERALAPVPVEPDGVATPAPPAAAEPAPDAVRPIPRVRSPGRVAPPPAPEADPSSTLREEIALLDRAIRARNAGDVARAAAVLEEHRTRFPSGRLQPDRDRLLAELASSAPAPTPP